MSNKNSSKKQQQRQLVIQQLEKQQKQRDAQTKIKQKQLLQHQKKIAPLVDYGLLDAYDYFLGQLATAGIPQASVFQFAAQSLLKFQRNKNKKQQKLKQVQQINQEAVRFVGSPPKKAKSRPHREIKPQMLPFDLNPAELKLMKKK